MLKACFCLWPATLATETTKTDDVLDFVCIFVTLPQVALRKKEDEREKYRTKKEKGKPMKKKE